MLGMKKNVSSRVIWISPADSILKLQGGKLADTMIVTKKKSALDSLSAIENCFATLRDK